MKKEFNFSNNQKYSTDTILNELGFVQEIQKKSFKNLCKYANINLPDFLDTELLLKLIFDTQILFKNRKHKQERWEVIPLDWMKKYSKQSLVDLQILKFAEEILPKKDFYNNICILGAVNYTMQIRISWLKNLIDSGLRVKNIFLLTGERYASHIDGSDEKLQIISQKFGVNKDKLTEAHLMKNLFDNIFTDNNNYNVTLINTLEANNRRPTTRTTVEDFCKIIKFNNITEPVLFVSNQPYVLYQKSVISEVMRESNLNIDFEVVGTKTNSTDIQSTVGSLGSYLWVSIPYIMYKLDLVAQSETEIELAKSLYSSDSIFYKYITKTY